MSAGTFARPVKPTEEQFKADIAAVGAIDAIPTILDVVCRTTGMGFAAVARVTEDRWIACAVRDDISFGLLPGGELEVHTTICDEIRDSGAHVVINHVAESEYFRAHHTPLQYGFQSYISVPINLPTGEFFGTLCAIDPKPAELDNPAVVGMFRMFADLIAFHLNAVRRLDQQEIELRDERQTAELREQFIAILGHDLRNPLASIDAGATALSMMPQGSDITPVVGLIQRSVSRMSGLIENVLDFARGRLGGGIGIHRSREDQLRPTLEHVVQELQSTWPGRAVEVDWQISHPVSADFARIAQLSSNLLANALHHGSASEPVRVFAQTTASTFELQVSNGGAPIVPELMEHLFKPFSRSAVKPGQQGLGLGLYIASQIAEAHDGTLTVESDARATRFTFRMPSHT